MPPPVFEYDYCFTTIKAMSKGDAKVGRSERDNLMSIFNGLDRLHGKPDGYRQGMGKGLQLLRE
jgi:hypothetical protein